MAREILWVDGVPAETKQALQEAAKSLYGQENASLMVRALIANHFAKSAKGCAALTSDQASDTVRVEIRLPRTALNKIDELAEQRFSKRNYYIVSLILSHVGQPQLQPDEIEVLRRSNYELAKIGTNVNQIAKAFNTLVKIGGGEKLPELGKKLAAFRSEVKEHTSKVLRVLNAGTAALENGAAVRGLKRSSKQKKGA